MITSRVSLTFSGCKEIEHLFQIPSSERRKEALLQKGSFTYDASIIFLKFDTPSQLRVKIVFLFFSYFYSTPVSDVFQLPLLHTG